MGGRRKSHVIASALMEYAEPPDASKGEYICRALGSRGSNKIDVELPDGHQALVILPAKFHKKIWIGKGTFVIVQASDDGIDEDGKRSFNGEIVRVLMKDDEKYLKSLGSVWPERFFSQKNSLNNHDDDDDDDDLPEHLQRVQNRRVVVYDDDDDSDDSDDEEEE